MILTQLSKLYNSTHCHCIIRKVSSILFESFLCFYLFYIFFWIFFLFPFSNTIWIGIHYYRLDISFLFILTKKNLINFLLKRITEYRVLKWSKLIYIRIYANISITFYPARHLNLYSLCFMSIKLFYLTKLRVKTWHTNFFNCKNINELNLTKLLKMQMNMTRYLFLK